MEEITVHALAEVIKGGSTRVIDVREPVEYRSGHVPGAELITMATVPLRLADLPRAEKLHVICESGARSYQVCAYLENHGYQVTTVTGGTGAWRMNGLPIVQGMSPR
ncbi:MAG TPA: rhodanese-like domain-containing protein [Candidatus Nanopelagicaceae bacterium]|nr:rhodanese-like domain-containing protein [Candidatus Nanopelagicaceae bacterium]